jgi:hypothetical protein
VKNRFGFSPRATRSKKGVVGEGVGEGKVKGKEKAKGKGKGKKVTEENEEGEEEVEEPSTRRRTRASTIVDEAGDTTPTAAGVGVGLKGKKTVAESDSRVTRRRSLADEAEKKQIEVEGNIGKRLKSGEGGGG